MMKKSQILAAIALAMALGVVAPVVSVSAAATPAGSEAAKLVDGEVDKMKAEFGTVSTYNANGSTTVNNGYAYYGTAVSKIDAAQAVIDGQKATEAGTIATGAATALNTAATNGVFAAADVTAITSAPGWGTNYDKTAALVNGAKNKLNAVKDTAGSTTQNNVDANAAITSLNTLLDAAVTSIDGVVAADASGEFAAVDAIAHDLTNDTIVAPTTVAEYNAIVAKISSKLPKIAAYRRVTAELTKSGLENLITTNYSERQIKELIANMWAAYNGTAITTPSDQIVNDANGVNAPATGIAGTAEGTATTVSIVAGLATALTALGAGVVAYRSARRK